MSDAELKAMDRAGVRGVRFNFVRRLVDFTPREVPSFSLHCLCAARARRDGGLLRANTVNSHGRAE